MKKKPSGSYPLEFKKSSVQLAVNSDQPISQTARELGINVNTLYCWIGKHRDSKEEKEGSSSTAQDEIRQLKKRLAFVTQERDLLKKAAAYFAKESQ